MSVAQINSWRLAGCGDGCIPRRHDPLDHERYGHESGYARAVEDMRPRVVEVGCLSIDLISKVVTVDDERVPLTPTEYRIMACLAGSVGRRLPLGEIAQSVLGRSDGRDDAHNIRVNMARMREKLGPAAGLIYTEPGFGYVLRHSQRDPFRLPVRGAS